MSPPRTRRGYRAFRPSKRKRAELLTFYEQVFSNKESGALPRAKTPAKQAESGIAFTNKQGETQTINQVVDYADTDYFKDTSELFPQLEQAVFLREDVKDTAFDDEGRPNLTGRRLIVREAIHMTKGQYGPYFALHVLVDGLLSENNPNGEFSVLTKGDNVNEDMSNLAGIELETGRVYNREAPLQRDQGVALRILFAKGAGAYEGYFYSAPVASAVEV